MAGIDPNIDKALLDPNTRYALDVQENEAYTKAVGLRGSERVISNAAKVFVNQPQKFDALKSLTGEVIKRRWAVFDLPKNDHPIFIYDSPDYSEERLEANLEIVTNLDCSCENKEEQVMREQEKSVIQAFCHGQLENKKNYDQIRLRILEFIKG